MGPGSVALASSLGFKENESNYSGDHRREVIATNDGPKAIGPYSQAIKANGFVFVSGQIPIDPATQQLI